MTSSYFKIPQKSRSIEHLFFKAAFGWFSSWVGWSLKTPPFFQVDFHPSWKQLLKTAAVNCLWILLQLGQGIFCLCLQVFYLTRSRQLFDFSGSEILSLDVGWLEESWGGKTTVWMFPKTLVNNRRSSNLHGFSTAGFRTKHEFSAINWEFAPFQSLKQNGLGIWCFLCWSVCFFAGEKFEGQCRARSEERV